MIEPIEHTYWECPVCRARYGSYVEAYKCGNQPHPTPRFQVGDRVYVRERYPVEPHRPFVLRTIVRVYGVNEGRDDPYWYNHSSVDHEVRYALDRPVEVGKGMVLGLPQSGLSIDEPCSIPEYYLLGLGDVLPDGLGGVLHEGLVWVGI